MQSHQPSAILHVDIHFKCKVKYMTLIYPKAQWNEMGNKTRINYSKEY